MKQLISMELNKAIKNRWFAIALAIGCALACASAFVSISAFFSYGFDTLDSTRYYQLSTSGSICAWIGVGRLDSTFLPWLFFGIAPLLVTLPYTWSLRSELVSGYINQPISRASRANYIVSKYIAVFCSAGIAIAVPLALNYLIVSCFIPSYIPDPGEGLSVPIDEYCLFSQLFFTYPPAYFTVIVLFDFILCGAWATVVLSLSFFLDNRIGLLVIPFLFQYFLRYANQIFLPELFGEAFRNQFNLISMLWPVPSGDVPNLLLSCLLVAIGLTASLVLCTTAIRRDLP